MLLNLYNLGGILLDVSIGILLVATIVRTILSVRYVKRNGSRTLTEEQRKTMKKIVVPIIVAALLTGIGSTICFIV